MGEPALGASPAQDRVAQSNSFDRESAMVRFIQETPIDEFVGVAGGSRSSVVQ